MRKSLRKTPVLIVRLGTMGDILLASPVAQTIKHRNPNAHICWLIQTEYKDALEGNPAVDEIICWDRSAWIALLRQGKFLSLLNEIRVIQRQLRSYAFDLAFDLQGVMISGFLTWLSRARTRIGLGSREGNNLFMTRTISRNLIDRTQIGAEYRYFMYQLGYPESDWKMYVPLAENPDTNTHNFLNDILNNSLNNDNYAVICPLSPDAQNLWPEEHWQQVILRIRGRYQLKSIILSEGKDQKIAQNISKLCGAINLGGKISFQDAGTLIKNASLLIGVDNEYTHIGHALKIPTISMFGTNFPYSHTGQESSTIIYPDEDCAPYAQKPNNDDKYDCMADISPDQVLTEIKSMMKNFFEPQQ